MRERDYVNHDSDEVDAALSNLKGKERISPVSALQKMVKAFSNIASFEAGNSQRMWSRAAHCSRRIRRMAKLCR